MKIYSIKNKLRINHLYKLFFLLFILFFFQNQQSFAQSISLSNTRLTLKTAFTEIEKQTRMSVDYNREVIDVNKTVTIQAKTGSLSDIMTALLQGTGCTYAISENHIVISALPVIQQNNRKNITGIITDERGEPIIGANIIEKGTTNGIISNIDGEFALTVSENAVLQVSYIGYTNQEFRIGNQAFLKIILKEDSQALDEVVVVGYGIQKKVNLTGAVSSIKSEELERQPVVTLKDALAGLAPGMTVTKSSGQPGTSNADISIRGVGTWQDSGPLVLVDGMSMSIGDVLPSDIESISVLKDAASAAIYGSRAANGVILITTKQGKAGKLQITYNGSLGWQKATRTPKMGTGWQYAELYNRAMVNDGKANPDGTTSLFPQDRIDRMKNGTGNIDANEANTDWFAEILQTAPQYTQDVTVTGGNDVIVYTGTLGWAKQEGVIASSYERYNTRLNTTATITKWLQLTSNIAYINDVSKESGTSPESAYYKVPRALPYMPVKYSDETWSFHSTPTNPVRMTTSDYGYQNYETDKLSLLVSPEVKLFDNSLIFKGTLGYESKTSYVDKFTKTVKYDAFEPAGQAENTLVARNEKSDQWIRNRNLTLIGTANYTKTFGKHDVNVLVGGSKEQFRYNMTTAARKDFSNNDFEVINGGDLSTSTASGNKTYASLVSAFGRVNYGYDNRYLFEANLRHDGSSKFKRGHRWGTFPSFSAAWRISEEAFFDPFKTSVQNLKLRASWGKLGNQSIGNYLSMSTYALTTSRFYMFDGNTQSLFVESVMGNELITWETSTNLNFGLDVNVLDNRLGITFDWYTRTTEDILLKLEAPRVLGIEPAISNAGEVRNRGWELSVNWQDKISEDFRYHIGLILSDVKNEIIDLKGYKSPTGDLTARIEGEPIDALFGWKTLGLADTQEKYEQYKEVMKTYNPNFGMGDIIMVDLNGDGKIDANDKTVIGNQIPRYTYSINLGFDYKGFDFSALFQGVGKVDGFIGRDVIEPLGVMSVFKDHYTDSFDPQNPQTGKYFPRMSIDSRLNYANMEHWVQDASYLRLKTLQLGYTFKFNPTFPIDRMRLYFSGQNLFTITKYRIYDPENGLNNTSFPNVAVYSFGANITF